ncbi:unnamed protein product [Rotaria sp. Silwood2]|nr:unnamed protein product [Rotaria sp. Silwood2]CAF2979792.1 unnamed protein product [Rotaria sp. Silwood2]CAF3180930.1 unnamed protein product [Rotaria sp. Silwood2]CAF3331399.1 unnamed protein product [Rotaria sp. Silwood2]CAF3987306.1 unnamed protein product [Rotaria sp. Silwood2]
MPSNGYYNVSNLHLILTSLIYLFTQYQKCYSFTAIAPTPSPSSSLLYEGAINITSHMSDEQRLFYIIMTGYEKAVRPLKKSSEAVIVKLGITLTQILDIEWNDAYLKWDPKDFGGLKRIRIPCRLIWLPDIVLYNSADDYTQGYMQSLAMIDFNGTVFWPPIVKFRSTCKIDITWFPFDDQLCFLKFGSWTYDSTQLILTNRSENVDMNNYIDNGEWKLLASWTILSTLTYPCCAEAYHDLKFYFHIRRRTLYYTFNVIIPCIMLSGLTCLTFYLPTESGEKVSLGLTVLLSFSVFMLVIAESMPATSEFVPLIGIYFTFVMGLTSLSVLLAVVLLNVHLYGSALKPVPRRLRRILFSHIAPCLHVKLHRTITTKDKRNTQCASTSALRRSTTIYNAVFLNENDLSTNSQPLLSSPSHVLHSTTMTENHTAPMNSETQNILSTSTTSNINSTRQSLQECKRLLYELNRLILRPGETREEDTIIRDWQNVALVIDRCLFYTYLLLTTILTVFTLLLAPLLKTIPTPPEYFRLNMTKE